MSKEPARDGVAEVQVTSAMRSRVYDGAADDSGQTHADVVEKLRGKVVMADRDGT